MRKTIMEKLGLEPVRKLNKTICLERVRKLQARIRSGRIPKHLSRHADYYSQWYGWLAKNGGHRGKKPAA